MSLLVCEAEYPSYRALVRHSLESNVVTSTSLDKEAENQVSLLVTSLCFFLLKNKTKTNKQINLALLSAAHIVKLEWHRED